MASMSKRQQARTEKDLQDVLRSVPGNNQCADCQARNPGWASWNLGIFLCMRCASIHRKLGTHISKVKSLSMDTWTPEQVEIMRQNGNVAVNKIYNPKNKRPDIPLDADEVDSAMERYIRKKYQEKSLSDGKPKPPSRKEDESSYARSPVSRQPNPESPETSPPPLPPKKGKFFGFGLRAVTSAYPLSKHDKKNLAREPVVDRAFRISSENYSSRTYQEGKRSRMSEEELQAKLETLRDMGFTDTRRNTTVLEGLNGDVERTIEALVRLGKSDKPSKGLVPAPPSKDTASASVAFPSEARSATVPTPSTSTNPFDQSLEQPNGLSFASNIQEQQPGPNSAPQRTLSNNPFDMPVRQQNDSGLNQAFQGMQLSQPLFPHSTGGYPVQPPPMQDPRLQHSMTPPAPVMSQHYGFLASPPAIPGSTNPFFQSQPTQQMTGNNPYSTIVQNPTAQSIPSNPFFNQPATFNQASYIAAPQSIPTRQFQEMDASYNPFGIPPSQPAPYQNVQQQVMSSQNSSIFDSNEQQFNTAQVQAPLQFSPQHQAQLSPSLPNFNYGQPQSGQFQSVQMRPQNLPQLLPLQQSQQPLIPQQTGRIDKSSILALYNYPQLAPQPLASISEPNDAGTISSQGISPAPGNDIFNGNTLMSSKRSVTMPVSLMHSSGGAGSRNPFFPSTSPNGSLPSMVANTGIRHASAESVNVNNLESGRHSPDAFANLSARYMR